MGWWGSEDEEMAGWKRGQRTKRKEKGKRELPFQIWERIELIYWSWCVLGGGRGSEMWSGGAQGGWEFRIN